MENEVKKSNKGLYAIITILCIAVLGLGGFIVYKEFIEKDKDEKECTCKKCDVKDNITDNTTTDDNTSTAVPFKPTEFNGNKALNGAKDTEYHYSDNNDSIENIGLRATINDDEKSVNLAIRWSAYGQYVDIESTEMAYKDYTISFSKEVKKVLLSSYGQDATNMILYALMGDGTVEYVQLWKTFKDSKNVNATLKSAGAIESVKDAIYLAEGFSYPTCEGCLSGHGEAYAFKADGSFYVLPENISK